MSRAAGALDYEDADPAKTEQHKRWRALKKIQAENDANAAASRLLACASRVRLF